MITTKQTSAPDRQLTASYRDMVATLIVSLTGFFGVIAACIVARWS